MNHPSEKLGDWLSRLLGLKPAPGKTREGGFTLVEIMIVVAIIAILTTIAWPSYVRARERSQNTRVINDLRIFSGAFEQYATETRGTGANYFWPPDQMPGVFPPEMAGLIKEEQFAAGPAIGGDYDWDVGVFSVRASISVLDPTAGTPQLTKLDEMMDDGDLSSGSFRQEGTRYLYVLEEGN